MPELWLRADIDKPEALPSAHLRLRSQADKSSAPVGGLMKYWAGSAWQAKPVKFWNGSTWQQKPVKRWAGSAWEPA